jgi:hypothetical protein
MANNPILVSQNVTADTTTRLTEYSFEFEQVYQAQPGSWAEAMGMVRLSNMILTRFPMSASSALFRKLVGDMQYRRLAEKFMQVTVPDPWQDGVREKAEILEAPDFTGWGMEPSNLAIDAAALPNRAVAAALAAAKTATTWEDDYAGGKFFFDAAHETNPVEANGTTYKNLYTTFGLTTDNIDTIWTDVRKIKAANGSTPRGLRLGGVMVPSAMERSAKRLLESDRILVPSGSSTATVERYNDVKELGLKVIVCDELTEDGVWYPFLSQPGVGVPWIIQKRIPGLPLPMTGMSPAQVAAMNASAPAPFEWIINDKSSDYYKNGSNGGTPGFVSIAAKLSLGVTLAHPWMIYRCET